MQEIRRALIVDREFAKHAKLVQKELRCTLKDLDKFEKRSRKSKIVVGRDGDIRRTANEESKEVGSGS
jgi:hypothetical protein